MSVSRTGTERTFHIQPPFPSLLSAEMFELLPDVNKPILPAVAVDPLGTKHLTATVTSLPLQKLRLADDSIWSSFPFAAVDVTLTEYPLMPSTSVNSLADVALVRVQPSGSAPVKVEKLPFSKRLYPAI